MNKNAAIVQRASTHIGNYKSQKPISETKQVEDSASIYKKLQKLKEEQK